MRAEEMAHYLAVHSALPKDRSSLTSGSLQPPLTAPVDLMPLASLGSCTHMHITHIQTHEYI